MGATLGSAENPAMSQEVLTTQLPASQPGKYAALSNGDTNCLIGFRDPLVPSRSSVIEQFYMVRHIQTK